MLKYVDDPNVPVDINQIEQVKKSLDGARASMDDDFNTAQAIGHLFNILKKINSIYTGQLSASAFGNEVFDNMIQTFDRFITEILGLVEEKLSEQESLLNVLLNVYQEAKTARNYQKVDEIRSALKELGIIVKDMKNKIDWAYEE